MAGPQVVALSKRGMIGAGQLQGLRGLPEVVVYQDDLFQGWEYRTNLPVSSLGDTMDKKISSIIVISGTWRFYEEPNFGGRYFDVTTGYHQSVYDLSLSSPTGPNWNDRISSFEPVAL